MDFYKERIQYDGITDKLNLIIVVSGDFQNKEIIGDTWSPTAPTRNLKYFLSDYYNNKARVHQLNFIGAFIEANVKHRVFVKSDSIYGK